MSSKKNVRQVWEDAKHSCSGQKNFWACVKSKVCKKLRLSESTDFTDLLLIGLPMSEAVLAIQNRRPRALKEKLEWDPKSKVFIDSDPVEGFKNMFIYVDFPSLDRAHVGFYLTKSGPKDPEIDSVKVDTTGFDPSNVAPLTDHSEAVKMLKSGDFQPFAEYPYVEVASKEAYDELAGAAGADPHETWEFDGPGVYDFRDKPPTKSYDSVEEYELQGMQSAADDCIEFVFQSDEWKTAADKLAKANPEDVIRESQKPARKHEAEDDEEEDVYLEVDAPENEIEDMEALIRSEYGSSIADQWNNIAVREEPLNDQNSNALFAIQKFLAQRTREDWAEGAAVSIEEYLATRRNEQSEEQAGWTKSSHQKQWKSLGGSMTACMRKMKGKIKDPGAFCMSAWQKAGKPPRPKRTPA